MVIITCVLSAAGTAGLVLATSQQHMEALLLDNAADDRERTAALLTSKVSLLKEALSAEVHGMPAALWSSPAGMADLLLARPVLTVLFSSVFAAVPDGRLLARIDQGRATAELPNIADRGYFKDALKSDQPVVSHALRSKISGAPLIIIAVPALDDQGRAIGVLAGSLALQSTALFQDVHTDSRNSQSRDLVIDRAGTILSHPDAERVMARAEDEPGLGPTIRAWIGAGSPIDTDGTASLEQGFLVSMAGIPLTDWIHVRLTPAAVALQPMAAARATAWRAAAAMGVLAGLLAGVLAYCMTQPISRLKSRAEALLNAGAVPADWAAERGEVGELSSVFQHVVKQRQQQQAEMQALVVQLEAVLDHAEAGISLTRDGRFELVSLNFCHIFRCSKADMTGQPTRLIYPSDEAFQAIVRQARPAITADGLFNTELELMRRNGETFWAHMRGRAILAGNSSKGTIWTIEDITAMRAQREQLAFSATHDPLTGLANRVAFEDALGPATEASAAAPFCALFIDLDRFKQVNDSGGHAAGDAMLCGVARAIEHQVRKSDLVARLGGDEFAVLLPDCPEAQGLAVAEKLCAAVSAFELHWEGQTFTVGASVGLVRVAGDLATAADVLRAADAACYAAKKRGRSRVEIHQPSDLDALTPA
ncbi:MAG: diguanylate cyclase [Microbacteriaceae bacterium]|nr:diguanylate cyclase [Burkholderiaceae bacterium]